MTTFDAVYRGGALHPVAPLPLADGTAVRVTVVPAPPATPLTPGRAAYEMLRAIADMPAEGGDPNVTSQNVDAILYGGPGGAR